MTHIKPAHMIADLITRTHAARQPKALHDALADPHLARDIGLPHQSRTVNPQRPLW